MKDADYYRTKLLMKAMDKYRKQETDKRDNALKNAAHHGGKIHPMDEADYRKAYQKEEKIITDECERNVGRLANALWQMEEDDVVEAVLYFLTNSDGRAVDTAR